MTDTCNQLSISQPPIENVEISSAQYLVRRIVSQGATCPPWNELRTDVIGQQLFVQFQPAANQMYLWYMYLWYMPT